MTRTSAFLQDFDFQAEQCRLKITMMIVSKLVMVLTFVLVESAIVRNDLAGFERWDSLKGDCFSSFRSQTDWGERKIIVSNFPEIYKFKTIQNHTFLVSLVTLTHPDGF